MKFHAVIVPLLRSQRIQTVSRSVGLRDGKSEPLRTLWNPVPIKVTLTPHSFILLFSLNKCYAFDTQCFGSSSSQIYVTLKTLQPLEPYSRGISC